MSQISESDTVSVNYYNTSYTFDILMESTHCNQCNSNIILYNCMKRSDRLSFSTKR